MIIVVQTIAKTVTYKKHHEIPGKFAMKYKFYILKVNFALIIMKYTVHLPFYLKQLSLLLRALNKICLELSVKDSVVSNKMGGELYISLYLEQNSPLESLFVRHVSKI